MQITGALVKFLICHSLLLSLDEELADLSLPLSSLHIGNSCFKELARKFFLVLGLGLSDANLNIADNHNTLLEDRYRHCLIIYAN